MTGVSQSRAVPSSADRDDRPSAGAERRRPHGVRVAAEYGDLRAGDRIPDAGESIAASRDELCPVCTHLDIGHALRVSVENQALARPRGCPDEHAAVRVATDDAPAVGAEREARQRSADPCCRAPIPHANDVRLTQPCKGDEGSVRAQCRALEGTELLRFDRRDRPQSRVDAGELLVRDENRRAVTAALDEQRALGSSRKPDAKSARDHRDSVAEACDDAIWTRAEQGLLDRRHVLVRTEHDARRGAEREDSLARRRQQTAVLSHVDARNRISRAADRAAAVCSRDGRAQCVLRRVGRLRVHGGERGVDRGLRVDGQQPECFRAQGFRARGLPLRPRVRPDGGQDGEQHGAGEHEGQPQPEAPSLGRELVLGHVVRPPREDRVGEAVVAHLVAGVGCVRAADRAEDAALREPCEQRVELGLGDAREPGEVRRPLRDPEA